MKNVIVFIIALFITTDSFGQSKSIPHLEESINEVFESYARYNRFIGNVLISQHGEILYKKSFGYADIEHHKKNTEQSIFDIASVTKPLTATGIMILAEKGKLSLETPINTFFPSFIPDFSKKITVRHLLNHSSGMQANVGRIDDQGNGLMPESDPVTLDELFERFKDTELKFEPGEGYEYNNFGYILLANIIETVSEQSYADFMEDAVFEPAKMKNTSVNNYKAEHLRAFPHTGLGMHEIKKINSPIHSSWLMGAGNINSTTADLLNFMVALEDGVLLNPNSVAKLYSLTQSRGVNDSEYGLGWLIEDKGEEKWINHTGLLPGVISIIGSLPQKNIKIIILSNATSTDLITESSFQGKDQFVNGEIIEKVISVLQGIDPDLLPMPVTMDSRQITDFSRTYKLDSDHSLILTKQGEEYSLETKGEEPWSVFTYKFSRDVRLENAASETALVFANAMSTQNLQGLSEYANDEMKGFLGSEEGISQLNGMWSYFISQAGAFDSYNIYKSGEKEGSKTVHIRFHFENDDVGFVLGLNANNKIQGIFMDETIRTNAILKVKLIPISEHEFFINGHQNGGMQDLKIRITETGLILIDDNINYTAAITTS